MPDFRGTRFSQGSAKFTPPRDARAIIPRPLGTLGAGKEPEPSTGFEAECRDNPAFKGGTVSITECYAYKALEIILGPEGEGWAYQESQLGGRHLPGGAVVDFIVYGYLDQDGDQIDIGIRVVTFYFHQAQGALKQASDTEQLLDLEADNIRIIDVFEEELLRDEQGKAALWVMRDAIAGIQHPNPLGSGMVLQL